MNIILPDILTEGQSSALRGYITDCIGQIVITCHVSPDGDAIGSSLALQRVLKNMGKDAVVVVPDTPPRTLSFLPGVRNIIIATRDTAAAKKAFADAALIFCLDFNQAMRVDRLADDLLASTAPKIMIDHHLMPEDFPSLTISHPEMSSTCSLLYRCMYEAGFDGYIDAQTATCLMTGMMTDTGNFTYNTRDSSVYLVVALLIDKGAEKDRIYKILFDTNSETRLRICGYALSSKMELFLDHRMSLIQLSRDELESMGYVKGDTESLVNTPLTMPAIVYSVFMRQDEENFVKISCRSKGHFPVNILCEKLFGGGGHENAAGGEFYGPIGEAVDRLLEFIPEMDKYLPEQS